MRTLVLLLALLPVLHAQVKIPRGIVEVAELDRVRKQAQQEGKALIYVMVNAATSQNFVEEALEDYHRRFRTYGPMVLVRANVSAPQVPEEVRKALAGLKGYPRLVATDPADNTVIVTIPYLTIENRESGLREQRRVLQKFLSEKSRAPRMPPTPTPPFPPAPTAPPKHPQGG